MLGVGILPNLEDANGPATLEEKVEDNPETSLEGIPEPTIEDVPTPPIEDKPEP